MRDFSRADLLQSKKSSDIEAVAEAEIAITEDEVAEREAEADAAQCFVEAATKALKCDIILYQQMATTTHCISGSWQCTAYFSQASLYDVNNPAKTALLVRTDELGFTHSSVAEPFHSQLFPRTSLKFKKTSKQEVKSFIMDEWANVSLEGASSTQDDDDENSCIVVFEAATRNRYRTMCRIGTASGLSVYRCAYIAENFNDYSRIGIHDVFFSLKLVKVNQQEAFNKLNREVERNCLLPHHENLMGITKSFVDNEKLCVVFPYMDVGSLRSITAAKFPEGLPEHCIVLSLRETLSGLSIIHANGLIHKEINAGHIFFSSKPEIKLGYSATIYEHKLEHGSVQASSSSVLPSYSICEWAAAPEVYGTQNHSKASDIWMIGITALELAYGDLQVRDRDSFEDMVRTICKNKCLPKKEQNENPNPNKKKMGFLKGLIPSCAVPVKYNGREFSKDFVKMVVKCLNWDAEKRPDANELLRYDIFNRYMDIYFFRNEISLGGRILGDWRTS
ncbi:unnamed protein product [Fraxinus pennsylvanica]|uniref:Protein kinase domain-containing protein n=1 Tax=Fraxinus pennsylvanica TaxID=56036 RepID=A0AAD1ZJ41_9LAMI|nr:unnamed protein product [Fraxinus pennsylvanica]